MQRVETGLSRAPGVGAGQPVPSAELVQLHESVAKLMAHHGQWQFARSHMMAATQLAGEQPTIPEQDRAERVPVIPAVVGEAGAEDVERSELDPLTRTRHRDDLERQLDTLVTVSARDAGVAVVDVDHFGRINHTHGRLVGDRVLEQVADLLQRELPPRSVCARLEGDQFAIVLPDLSTQNAVVAMVRARTRVAEHEWSNVQPGMDVTVSIGLTHTATSEIRGVALPTEPESARQLRRAGELLGSAKRAGRNMVAYRIDGAIRLAGLDDTCR